MAVKGADAPLRSLGKKNKIQKFVTRNPGNTMGVSGHGSFFCLWAIRARFARARTLTEPWATPPTAGAMKIEQGGCASTSRHNSASRCAPLVWLVVAFPSASASPSCRASARSLGLRYSLCLNLSLSPSCSVGCRVAQHFNPHLIATPPGASASTSC
jgi:hypothetical protein